MAKKKRTTEAAAGPARLPALLREAVSFAPDDDAPRLVAADWFAERGEAERAELIRAQCAQERLDPADPRREALAQRARELERANAPAWAPALPGVTFSFRRGFPAVASGEPAAIAEAAEELLRAVPELTALALVNAGGARRVQPLVRTALWGQVREVSFIHLRDDFATELFQAGALGQVESLELELSRLTRATWRVLARAPDLAGLQALRLRQSNGALWARLGELPPGLRRLELEGCQVTAEDLQALARAPRFEALEALCLAHNPLAIEAAWAFVNYPAPALRRLDLSWCRFGGLAVETLAQASGLALRALSLRHSGLKGSEALPLAAAPCAEKLEWLDLRGNTLAPAATAKLRARFGAGLIV